MSFLSFIPLIGNIIDKVFPDTEKSNQMKLELMKQIQEGDLEEIKGRFDVISSEGSSVHWLAATWRPVTMMVFLGMIVSWWFGYIPPNATEGTVLELFSLLKIGLGGYVVGRSAEKVAKIWKETK